MNLPAIIITRTSIFPAFECGAHHADGKLIRHFVTDADLLVWIARHGYDLIAPDTWRRE
jgi:hypothetical protein